VSLDQINTAMKSSETLQQDESKQCFRLQGLPVQVDYLPVNTA